jgi:hypothetical protein
VGFEVLTAIVMKSTIFWDTLEDGTLNVSGSLAEIRDGNACRAMGNIGTHTQY